MNLIILLTVSVVFITIPAKFISSFVNFFIYLFIFNIQGKLTACIQSVNAVICPYWYAKNQICLTWICDFICLYMKVTRHLIENY